MGSVSIGKFEGAEFRRELTFSSVPEKIISPPAGEPMLEATDDETTTHFIPKGFSPV
jgi:hypothetical protein